MAAERILRGRSRVPGNAAGEALVTTEPLCFSPEYFDIPTGTYLERRHQLYGKSLAGRILVFPCGRGFSGGAYCIYALARHGCAPAGAVGAKLESVSLIGMVLASIPTIDECESDPLEIIRNGQSVTVDADHGLVRLG
ncbi:MAG: DUF126 domain-containing protein [Alphaproteobacteria bacterium]|jgi:hypothetical protein|nr:DUF126 domain-containing protein [Alphaproteobacteria bacterium]